MHAPAAFITGTGLISALGEGAASTIQAIRDGHAIRTHCVAQCESNGPFSRVGQLAFVAALEALASANWSSNVLHDPGTAIVFATSKGDIGEWTHNSHRSDNVMAGWSDGAFGVGRVCEEVCDRLGGPAGARLVISAACASGLHALIRAQMMLADGTAARVLVVAAEASIQPLFSASFARLGVLATDGEPGKPFDLRRAGFHISEAGAAVTLEKSPGQSPQKSPICITFGRLAGESSGLVAGDRDGNTLKYLLRAALALGPVNLIHAHGTGTRLNDEIEMQALEAELCGPDLVPVYSHKGVLGHSLGASGLVSVVLSEWMHKHQRVLPMVTTRAPELGRQIQIEPAGSSQVIASSLVLANGFGGPQAVVRLES